MSASTYPLTERRVEDYEALVEGRTHLDQLRDKFERLVSMPEVLASFRRSNQGTPSYDAWNPDVGLERAVKLSRANADSVGFIMQIEEIIIDPNMIFILSKVYA